MEPINVSIITTTFNSASTIADTLQSVASQTYPTIEHIIIDGGSSDETMKIVRTFPHIATAVSEKDHGIYDAMNKGIKRAGGEVVGILNSDDVYVNNKVIEKIANEFRDNAIDAVYGDLQYVDYNDSRRITRTWIAGRFKKKNFYYGWMPPHPTFFVRRKVYEQLGIFNLALKTSADYEILLRFLFKNNIAVKYIPEVLVKMRTGGASNATLKNRWKANREDRMAWKLNGLQPYFFTLFLKPVRKVKQFVIR